MLAPTAGDAQIDGKSITRHMGVIRRDLGVCPQFDILWPQISVLEHLELYAAIKGFQGADLHACALDAAKDVGETLLP